MKKTINANKLISLLEQDYEENADDGRLLHNVGCKYNFTKNAQKQIKIVKDGGTYDGREYFDVVYQIKDRYFAMRFKWCLPNSLELYKTYPPTKYIVDSFRGEVFPMLEPQYYEYYTKKERELLKDGFYS